MRTRMLRVWRALGWLLLVMAWPVVVAAQEAPPSAGPTEKVREANAECFACHSEAGLHAPPRDDLDLKKLRGLLQDPDTFYQADHRRQACTKCHNEGYDEYPHAEDAKDSTSTCVVCLSM